MLLTNDPLAGLLSAGMSVMALLSFASLGSPCVGEDISCDKLTLTDGRVLVGKYNATDSNIDIVDEKTGKVFGKISVPADKIKSSEPITISIAAPDPADQPGINGKWTTNYQQALTEAKDSHRTILALFTGSDWCPWCKKLDNEVLSKDEFKQWAKSKFVLLYLDYPRTKILSAQLQKQNKELEAKYAVHGYPDVVFIHASGEALQQWTWGYHDGGVLPWIKAVDDALAHFKF
jgi:thioredoxin-related protein